MKMAFITVGQVAKNYMQEGIEEYQKRFGKYCNLEYVEIKLPKSKKTTDALRLKEIERDEIFKHLKDNDYLVLLDERGKTYSSTQLATKMEKWMGSLQQRLVFLIGEAYGFHEDVYERKHEMLSLSELTFTHDMVRLVFLEQLYRAFTIINNEPYHH